MVEFVDEHFLVLILGVAAVLTAVWLYLMRNRLKTNLVIVILLSILHVIVGVGSVKLFAFLEGFGKEYNGAMSLFGAVFFMPFAYALGAKLTKRSMRDVFDIFTIPLVFTLLLSRINCLHAGCCYGLPIHVTSLRYPTREAEIIFYLVFMIIEVPKVYKGKTFGEVYPLYMMCYGIFRAVEECFRYSASTNSLFHVTHVWAMLAFGLGISIYIELKRQRHLRTNRKTPKGD